MGAACGIVSGLLRKRLRAWAVALLLPSLALRVLIPVGFMPMFGANHRVQLVICDGYAPLHDTHAAMAMPMNPAMPMEPGMTMDGGRDMPQDAAANDGGHPPVHQDHGFCPYGSSPALGALPTLALWPAMLPLAPEPAIAAPQIAHFEVSPRAQSPRGPPA